MTQAERRVLSLLKTAERALRENLHRSDLSPAARVHVERACSHVRESRVATVSPAEARSVEQLHQDLNKFDRLVEQIKSRNTSESLQIRT